jgi:hypothetical protein
MLDPPPEEPEDDAGMTFADSVEETANDVSSRIEAAAAAAEKEAIKVAAEAAACEELRQGRVNAEVEERRQAERQAHAARERTMPRHAEEINWKLSGGDGPAEWGKVLYNDKTSMQSHRTKFRSWLVTASVTDAFWAAVRNGWVKYGNAWYRIIAIGGDRLFEHSTSKQGAEAHWPPLPKQAAEDTSGLRPL